MVVSRSSFVASSYLSFTPGKKFFGSGGKLHHFAETFFASNAEVVRGEFVQKESRRLTFQFSDKEKVGKKKKHAWRQFLRITVIFSLFCRAVRFHYRKKVVFFQGRTPERADTPPRKPEIVEIPEKKRQVWRDGLPDEVKEVNKGFEFEFRCEKCCAEWNEDKTVLRVRQPVDRPEIPNLLISIGEKEFKNQEKVIFYCADNKYIYYYEEEGRVVGAESFEEIPHWKNLDYRRVELFIRLFCKNPKSRVEEILEDDV